MRHLTRTIVFSSLCILVSAGARGESGGTAPIIPEMMTAEQFRRAGLHKLSEDELKALEAWLRGHMGAFESRPQSSPATPPSPQEPGGGAAGAVAGAAPAGTPVDENFGFPDPPASTPEDVLHARIEQPFRGWSGKTIFRLDNGQVWKQRISGRFTYSGDDTRVEIRKNSWGFYELRLVDADRTVGVSRVQ